MRIDAIPSYDLYADPRSYAVPGFLHAETIRARARVHGWTIRRHRHETMWQAMFVTGGGGEALAENQRVAMRPPWFLWMPAGMVHGFDFVPGTEGFVVTASRDLLEQTLARDGFAFFEPLRERRVVAQLDPDGSVAKDLSWTMSALLAEHGYSGFGARAAASALFELIVVAAARIAGPEASSRRPSRSDAIAPRFRALVEASFRVQWPLSRYAAELGVTPDGLYEAIRRETGRAPQAILHDRVLVEAKRALLYTSMSIGEIAYDLGFDDPAYFTRFFTRRIGLPPSAFRAADGKEDGAAKGRGVGRTTPPRLAPVRGAVAEKRGDAEPV